MKVKIVFEVAYNGSKYNGLVSTNNEHNTITKNFKAALISAGLAPEENFFSFTNLIFIGRTDKGVHASRTICSLFVNKNIRNNSLKTAEHPSKNLKHLNHINLKENQIHNPSEDTTLTTQQALNPHKKQSSSNENGHSSKNRLAVLPYHKILNAFLPKDIRIIRFGKAPEDFNILGECISRSYNYFYSLRDDTSSFQKCSNFSECGSSFSFDIKKISKALETLKGTHDFRNLSKVDFSNKLNYVREIKEISICEWGSVNFSSIKYKILKFSFEADGFLWHMIRNIVGICLRIGKGLEDEDIFNYLMDVEKCKIKPTYEMAPPEGLYLTGYKLKDESKVEWEQKKDFKIRDRIFQNREARAIFDIVNWGVMAEEVYDSSYRHPEGFCSECGEVLRDKGSLKYKIDRSQRTFEEKFTKYLSEQKE